MELDLCKECLDYLKKKKSHVSLRKLKADIAWRQSSRATIMTHKGNVDNEGIYVCLCKKKLRKTYHVLISKNGVQPVHIATVIHILLAKYKKENKKNEYYMCYYN